MMLSLAVACVLSSAPDDPTRVAVLPIADASDSGVHKRIADELDAGFVRNGMSVVADALVRAAVVGVCSDAACARDVAARTGARWVVRPTVEHHDRSYALTLELLDGKTGDVVARKRDECDICGLEEVAELTADQVAVLQREITALDRGQTSVHIESTPSGAQVWLDGELVGVTPLWRQTTPGRHRLRVEHAGYVAVEHEIEAARDVEKAATLRLDPLPVDRGARRGPPLVPIGITALLAGVALIGGGTGLVVLDGREYRRQCSGDDVDINGTCRFSYDTLAGGATALALGVVATGAGIALVVVGKRRGRTTVALAPKGLVVRGRF